jgi:hypothetical protein
VSADPKALLRRWALFVAFLLSGGLLIFPRLPLLVLLVLLCVWIHGGRLTLERRMAPIAAVLGLVLLVTVWRPGELDLVSLAIRYANFIGAWMLLSVYLAAPAGSLAHDLAAVLRWLAWQALATLALALAVPQLFAAVDVNGTPYLTIGWIFTYHVLLEGATGWPRPDGFFFEPGVFQLYLNLYLYVTLFVLRRPGQALLAGLAVLSTQSTTGVAIAVLLVGGAALRSLREGRPAQRVLRLGAMLAVLAPLAWFAADNVTDKILGEGAGSALARQHDFFTGLNVIAAHPWLGIGFEHARFLEVSGERMYADTQLSEEGREDRAMSNGLIYATYALGIPLATLFLAGLFAQRLLPHRIAVGLLLALSLFGESIVFTPFVLMFVFSAWLLPARAAATAPRAVDLPRPAVPGASA